MARPRRQTQFLLGAVTFGGGLAGSLLTTAFATKAHPKVGVALAIALFFAAMIVVLASSFMKVHVADDGVTLAKWRASRFVPWPELRSIDPAPNAVILMVRGGAIALPFEARTRSSRAARDTFITHLRDALAKHAPIAADLDDE